MADDGYSGVLGAFPYAFGRSGSRTFRLYVLVAGLVGAGLAFVIAGGVLSLLAETGRTEGTTGFVRGFYVVVGVTALAPMLAPVLLVARRHRREGGSPRRYDTAMGAAGFAFILSLYVGLVASTPPARQETVAPFILVLGSQRIVIDLPVTIAESLYGLPRAAGLLFPGVGAALVALAHRLAP